MNATPLLQLIARALTLGFVRSAVLARGIALFAGITVAGSILAGGAIGHFAARGQSAEAAGEGDPDVIAMRALPPADVRLVALGVMAAAHYRGASAKGSLR